MKKLKIIALSLAMLLVASQANAAAPVWLNKAFEFIKGRPKTSLVIGVGVAAIISIAAIFGCRYFKSHKENTGATDEAKKPKKTCAIIKDDNDRYTMALLEHIKKESKLKDFDLHELEQEDIDSLNNSEKKYDLLLCARLKETPDEVSINKLENFNKMQQLSRETIIIVARAYQEEKVVVEDAIPNIRKNTTAISFALEREQVKTCPKNNVASKGLEAIIKKVLSAKEETN